MDRVEVRNTQERAEGEEQGNTSLPENMEEDMETGNSDGIGETNMETDINLVDSENKTGTVAKAEKKGGGGLIWTLQPHDYDSLCSLERLYRTGVLKKAFENDVKNSGCFDSFNLDDLKVDVSFKEADLRACKEELSLGEAFHNLNGRWNSPNPPCASRQECAESVRKLAEHHLLITSPFVTKYLRNHRPLFMKLGEIALEQYVTRERDLESIAKKLGYSLLDDDILNSGFVSIDPSAPSQSVFSSEELRAWFAAYCVVTKPAIYKLDDLKYPTVDAFVADGDFHLCLINRESCYIYRIASRMRLTEVDNTDVQKLIAWLQKLEGPVGPLHDPIGIRGFYVGQLMGLLFQCKRWTLSRLGLESQDLETIEEGFHHSHGGVGPLDIIDLSHNQLAGGGASLARFMMHQDQCKHWDISNTGLTAQDFADLAETVGDKKLEQLTELVLDHSEDMNGGDQRIQSLVDLMPQCHISFKGGTG